MPKITQLRSSGIRITPRWLGWSSCVLTQYANHFSPCQGLITYDTACRNIRIGINCILGTKCHLQKDWKTWRRHCSDTNMTKQGMVTKALSSAAIFNTFRTTLSLTPFKPCLTGGFPHLLTIPNSSTHMLNTS